MRNSAQSLEERRVYGVWSTMRNRCNNPKATSFKDYGGRGIKVCDRWSSFENFIADMGPRPSPHHQIDRMDNDGDYELSNCCWATRAEQVTHKRNTRLITANGETLHMAEWARRLGCNPAAILCRMNKGWSEHDAVTVPIPDRPNSKLTEDQVREIRERRESGASMQAIADKFVVSKKTVLNIIHRRIFADV